MIVVIEKNENGKIEFTQKELEELLEKARAEGAREAQKTNHIYTQPSIPSPAIPNSIPNTPYWSNPVTCGTPNAISDNASSATANPFYVNPKETAENPV